MQFVMISLTYLLNWSAIAELLQMKQVLRIITGECWHGIFLARYCTLSPPSNSVTLL